MKDSSSAEDQHIRTAETPLDSCGQVADVLVLCHVRAADMRSPALQSGLFSDSLQRVSAPCHEANLSTVARKIER